MLSTATLAAAKGFVSEELEMFGLRDRDGIVEIPYHNVDGSEYSRMRLRSDVVAKNGSTWSPGSDGLIPYGLYQPVVIADNVYIVEGETDSWSLWTSGLAALGIPGASNARRIHAEHVGAATEVHVIQEPGEAGGRFPHAVALALYDTGFSGQVYGGPMLDGYKDPQEAFAALERHAFLALMTRVSGSMIPILKPAPVAIEVTRAVPQPVGSALIKDFASVPDPRIYSTGNTLLDQIIGGGLYPGEMTLIVARSGVGKTGWANDVALAVSRSCNAPNNYVLAMPLEMRRLRTERLLLAKILLCDVKWIQFLQQSNMQEHKAELARGLSELQKHHIDIIAPDRADEEFTIDRIIEEIRARKTKPNVVVIDQLRSIDGWGLEGRLMRDQACARTIRKLKVLGEDEGIHMLLVHQLKPVKLTKGQRPEDDDIADGAPIFQACDTVIAIHRAFKAMPDKDTVAELIPLKNRRGPHPWIHTYFSGPSISFPPMDRNEASRAACCRVKETPKSNIHSLSGGDER